MFFTNIGSRMSSAKYASSAGDFRRSLSSKSSISRCCSELKVTTPIDNPESLNSGFFSRDTMWSTKAKASGLLMRAPPFS